MLEEKRVVEKRKGMVIMKTLTVNENLTKEARTFLINVAKEMKYNPFQIAEILNTDMLDFFEIERELGIRMCESENCYVVFDEGFLTEDSDVFCSEKCCYDSIMDLTEDDFGVYVYYTN